MKFFCALKEKLQGEFKHIQ